MTRLLALLVVLPLALPARAEERTPAPPRLVVLVSVDQLRPDVLRRYASEYRGGLRRFLLAHDGVRSVFTKQDLLDVAADDPVRRLASASYAPDRGGELVVIPKRGVLVTRDGRTGTSHGSPWPYDREVPLAFLGPGFSPGAAGAARTVDIAPTLARRIGVPAPADVDGRTHE